MTRFGGMEIDVANNLCKDAFKDILSGKVHAYNRLWQVNKCLLVLEGGES